MAEAAGEEQTTAPATNAGRRFWVTWGIAGTLILLGFAVTVAVLNSTIYSAQGFVASYLDALERRDLPAALATSGVTTRESAADDLLVPDALGPLAEVELVSETDLGGSIHVVVYDYELDGTPGTTDFEIEHTGNRLGFFQTWSFVRSPAATLEITPLNESRFDAGRLPLDSAGGPNVPVVYDVLTPSVIDVRHESQLLVADRESAFAVEPGATTRVSVRTRANEEFVRLVQEELDRALDECTEQQVLQPTGCPFGEVITNRVEGTPNWSIAEYPVVTIEPGDEAGTWRVPETTGAAHLIVGVRSIFDGTRSTFDEDVPFTVSYLITFVDGGGIRIDAQAADPSGSSR